MVPTPLNPVIKSDISASSDPFCAPPAATSGGTAGEVHLGDTYKRAYREGCTPRDTHQGGI